MLATGVNMRSFLAFLSLALYLEFASFAAGAELNGRIVLTKNLTKKRITMPVYHLRGVSSPAAASNSGPVNVYKDVVVFLEGKLSNADRPTQAELVQQNQRFEPQMLVVPVGSTVSFPNADPIFHNVFSLSSAKKFDLGYYPAGQTRVMKFDEAGVVQVYCHLHPNMYAAIVVVPNHWYTRPADDGTFSLGHLPPGKYHLVAWHMSAGFFRKQIEMTTGADADVILKIPVHDEEYGH